MFGTESFRLESWGDRNQKIMGTTTILSGVLSKVLFSSFLESNQISTDAKANVAGIIGDDSEIPHPLLSIHQPFYTSLSSRILIRGNYQVPTEEYTYDDCLKCPKCPIY